MKFWVDERMEDAGEFETFCKADGIQIYSTLSETKAAFAECTTRSLKNILYPYMEDYGYKYFQKLSQVVTTLNSRNLCLIPKNVKTSGFLCILYSKPLRDFRKTKFRIGDRVFMSMYNLLFRKGYKPRFTQAVFEIVSVFSRNLPTYTKIDEQDEIILGKFYQKELIKIN